MKISILNQSCMAPELTPSVLGRIVDALDRQCMEHFAPAWEILPPELTTQDDTSAFPIVIFDSADQAGVLGYHSVDPLGRAYGRVFLAPILGGGGTLFESPNALSVTLSHEVLELIADPYVSFWSDSTAGKEVALEVCDPVEADAYDIDGVSVSNFITPRWFRAGPGPYDYMGMLGAPLGLTSGGYVIERDANGEVNFVWGEHYPEHKKAAKTHAAARSNRRKP